MQDYIPMTGKKINTPPKHLTIDEMKRNETKMFYDMYPRMGLCQDYSLDSVSKRELFKGISETDLTEIRNNTKFAQAPCWHTEEIKLGEVTEEQVNFAIKMTMAQMQCDGIEVDERLLNSLKAKYYGNK
jgi:hypothetical protein